MNKRKKIIFLAAFILVFLLGGVAAVGTILLTHAYPLASNMRSESLQGISVTAVEYRDESIWPLSWKNDGATIITFWDWKNDHPLLRRSIPHAAWPPNVLHIDERLLVVTLGGTNVFVHRRSPDSQSLASASFPFPIVGVSPDGTTLLGSEDKDGGTTLTVLDMGGIERFAHSFDTYIDIASPLFFDDGTKLTFVKVPGGPAELALYVWNLADDSITVIDTPAVQNLLATGAVPHIDTESGELFVGSALIKF